MSTDLFSGTSVDCAQREADAVDAVRAFADAHADAIRLLWGQVDGDGGAITDLIAKRLGIARAWDRPSVHSQRKDKIDAALRRQVMERDAYRCKRCGGYDDLCCDHIIPESKGGATTLDNLQAMCRSCNSRKGVKV